MTDVSGHRRAPAAPDPGAVGLIADPQVGTVSVCLPHHLHFPVALAGIQAGKNVLVEKPLTVSLDQARELVDAVAAAGVALGVSHNQIFYAPHTEAKRLIDTGAIGRPVFRDRQWSEVPVRPDDWQTCVQASVAAYLDAVTAGQAPPVTGTAALETMRILDRIYRTAAVLGDGNSPSRPTRL
jgi:predicted dehydrogenase